MASTHNKPTNLRRQLKQRVDGLAPERLADLAGFLGYLEYLDSEEATQEILAIPRAAEEIQRALKDADAGRTTPVANLRRKYRNVRRRAG